MSAIAPPKVRLDDLIIPHPEKTFFVRAAGESMLGAGIMPGDLLLVEKAEAAPGGGSAGQHPHNPSAIVKDL